MSPLMQTICDELRACALDRYIDGFERDAYAAELAQLYGALSAALPEGCKFHPRCKHCQEVCRLQPPPVQREGEHIYRCHFKLF